MNVIESHREAFKWSADLLEMVIADVTDTQAHWAPPGLANPIGATYAHAVCSIDAIIHTLFQEKKPFYAGEWAEKSGISDPRWESEFEWARTLKIDIPQTRIYAQAVYEAGDAYLAALSEEDLDRKIDMSSIGMGVRSVNWCINALVIGHNNNMAGEISVLKGIQGAKGYPF